MNDLLNHNIGIFFIVVVADEILSEIFFFKTLWCPLIIVFSEEIRYEILEQSNIFGFF